MNLLKHTTAILLIAAGINLAIVTVGKVFGL